VILEVVKIKVK